MQIHLFAEDSAPNTGGAAHKEPLTLPQIVRVETYLVHEPTEDQYTVMLLDAPDSFDVVITYPNGEKEIIWSLVKE